MDDSQHEAAGAPSRLERVSAVLGPEAFLVPCEWGTKKPVVTYVERPFEGTKTPAYRALFDSEPRNIAVYLGKASGTPAAPVIVTHTLEESVGEPLYWFDVVLTFTFEQGRFPDGTIEVYWARQSTGWVESYLGAVSSAMRSYRHARAFSDFEGDVVAYRMRYQCGTEIIGPFSQSYGFEYVAP